MGKQYKERQPTGREYVDKTREFTGITINRCLALPARWRDELTRPLTDLANKIEDEVVIANKVYLSPKNQSKEELLRAYGDRLSHLQEAIRLFGAFDIKFERLMHFVDVKGSEKRRLKNVLLSIIEQEKAVDPELQNIEIRVISRMDEMCYISANGEAKYKLKLTPKNKAYWLKTENEAISLIRKRIESDKNAVRKLTEPSGR